MAVLTPTWKSGLQPDTGPDGELIDDIVKNTSSGDHEDALVELQLKLGRLVDARRAHGAQKVHEILRRSTRAQAGADRGELLSVTERQLNS